MRFQLELLIVARRRLLKEKFMKNNIKDEMGDEYDFRGKKGVRGKYYKALQKGYKTIIHKSEGSTVVKETRPLFLDEDVQAYFPDSKSVNSALRGLIALAPKNKKLKF